MVFEKFRCNVPGHEKGECVMVCVNKTCPKKFLCSMCLKTMDTDHQHMASDLINFEKFIEQSTVSFLNGGGSRPDEEISKGIKDIKRIHALLITGNIREGKRLNEIAPIIKDVEKRYKASNSAPKSLLSFEKLAQKTKESKPLEGNLSGGDIKIKKKTAVVNPTSGSDTRTRRTSALEKGSEKKDGYTIKKKDLMDAPEVPKKPKLKENNTTKKRDLMDAPEIQKKQKSTESEVPDKTKNSSERKPVVAVVDDKARKPMSSRRNPEAQDIASVFAGLSEVSPFIKLEAPRCTSTVPKLIKNGT